MPISIFCFLSRLFNIVLENITIEIVKQRMVCLHKVRPLTANLIILSSPYTGIHSLYLDISKHILGFPGSSDGKESAWNATDTDSISGWGRPPEEGNSNPVQYSCLENSMDRGAWWLQSVESQWVGHNWTTNIFTFTFKIFWGKRKICPPKYAKWKELIYMETTRKKRNPFPH